MFAVFAWEPAIATVKPTLGQGSQHHPSLRGASNIPAPRLAPRQAAVESAGFYFILPDFCFNYLFLFYNWGSIPASILEGVWEDTWPAWGQLSGE